MQSDFDKILRENLKGYEADFNAADWQQMEAMLPDKSNKPYVLIALLLLLFGIGGLLVGAGEFQKGKSAPVIVQNNSSDDSKGNSVTKFKNENSIDSVVKNESSPNSETEAPQAKEQNRVAGSIEKTKNELTRESENIQVLSQKEEARDEVMTMKKNDSAEIISPKSNDSQKTSSRKKNQNTNSYEANSHRSYSGQIENTNGSSVEIQNNTETISALASIESGFIGLSNEEKTLAEKNALSEGASPKHKPKRKIVTFALGGGAGMNFSFIDAARWTKPGYSVDIAQELMFIHRIGIALTQGYTERKYDGGQPPCPAGTLDCPYSYNSTVRSVDFSVALKANLIHKTKWNWYVKGGVINTVKLKEEFNYNYPQTDTIHPPTLPPQTNFNGSGFPTSESMNDPNLGFDAGSSPSDLSISGAKRYHIAFLSATGFDVALKPNLNVQVEANHSFTQPTVGANKKRLNTIGINARCLYLFGR